jgi:hypothetical protein
LGSCFSALPLVGLFAVFGMLIMKQRDSFDLMIMPDANAAAADQALSELLDWVDEVADRFEAAWRSLTPPGLEEFLGAAGGERRALLLEELLKIDRGAGALGTQGGARKR